MNERWYEIKMYTMRTPVVFSSRVHETPHLLRGKYRDNRNSGATRIYQWQKGFDTPIPLKKLWWHCNSGNVHLSLQSRRRGCRITIYRGASPRLDQSYGVAGTSFQEYIWGWHGRQCTYTWKCWCHNYNSGEQKRQRIRCTMCDGPSIAPQCICLHPCSW